MDMRPVGKEQAGEVKKRIVVGPWGGHGGSPWDDGGFTGVREITLVYSLCIDSMTVIYDQNGKPYKAEKHGGVGGSKTAQIKLQFPGEYLTGVSGYYCPVVYGGSPVIRSLTFSSNRRTFGPFGVEEGTRFSLPMEGGQIVGFKGRSGWYLDAICCYIAKIKTTTVLQMAQQRLKKLASSVSLNYRYGDEQSKYHYYKGGEPTTTTTQYTPTRWGLGRVICRQALPLPERAERLFPIKGGEPSIPKNEAYENCLHCM